uniref:Uncharacterized protein n=1 Tax=Ditylenchus dipsaci TaxID=166011 RepID=A0A915DU61_9BILA
MTTSSKVEYDAWKPFSNERYFPQHHRRLRRPGKMHAPFLGVCMKIYKESSLKKDHLYIVQKELMKRNDRQSHACNGGEKIMKVLGRTIKLDGLDEANEHAYKCG